ncbi:hypothetical protein [Rhodospirillaceae bacterium SYSU D60014]|uniref:hypothetical protein n=1 Tax=Virgifigura deserti TaxID=2268457 RepID=UPI000E662766
MTLWPVPNGAAERLALAKGYPFFIPEESYLLADGAVRPLPALDDPVFAGRTPVLAVGSNQSPDQLRRKFAHFPPPARIPVTRAWLADFDVVYATHITRYGSIPGNLFPTPGARVRLSVTWLDAEQLAAMHATEIAGEHYVFGRLGAVELAIDNGPMLRQVHGYVSLQGCLREDDAPVGLAAIRAEGRPYPGLPQEAMLELLRRRCASPLALDDFILALVTDPDLRDACTQRLRADGLPFAWTHLDVVETG